MTLDLDVHLDAIVSRDAMAFGRWMAGAEPTLRASLRSFAAAVDVEAVVQESLLRVWQVAPRFVHDGAPNGLLRLALRIGRNLAVSETRRRRVQAVEDDTLERELARVSEEGPEAPDPLLRSVLATCYERLNDKPREAMSARLVGSVGEDDDTLAARLGMTLNTFLQNIGRARKALAECLRRHGVATPEGLSS